MKRKFLPAMIALIFILLVAVPSGFAQSPKEDPNKLKKSEHEALLNQVGMSEKDISNLPVSELRKLLANGAKKIASNEVTHTFSDSPSASDGIGTNSLVKGVDINLWGTAYSLGSDKPGNKKYAVYGNFTWLYSPSWELTDGYAIGYPSTIGAFLGMSGGNPTNFSSNYCYKPDNYAPDIWTCSPSTSPETWTPGTGVGKEFDLIAMPSNELHKGFIEQDIYIPDSNTGTANIQFSYGHKILSGQVAFDIYPVAGVSIQPTYATEVATYGIEFSY